MIDKISLTGQVLGFFFIKFINSSFINFGLLKIYIVVNFKVCKNNSTN